MVKIRSQRMAEAAAAPPQHGMLSVVGLPDPDLRRICDKALSQSPAGTVCKIANFLFPQVSGSVFWEGREEGRTWPIASPHNRFYFHIRAGS